MELSILRLGSPRKRGSSHYFLENESFSGSFCGSPSRRTMSQILDAEMTFEQHVAAIPFVWESKPGTPRRSIDGSSGEEDDYSHSDQSRASSRNSSARQTESSISEQSDHDFEFSSERYFETQKNTIQVEDRLAHADELFHKGHILPLKPPPAHNSIRQMMAADSEEPFSSSFNSGSYEPKSPVKSFRRDGLKALCSTPKREKAGWALTPLGFEDWPPASEADPGHRRSKSLFGRRKSSRDGTISASSKSTFGGNAKGGFFTKESRPAFGRSRSSFAGQKRDDPDEIAYDGSRDFDHSEDFSDALNPEEGQKVSKSEHPFMRLSRFFKNSRPSRFSAVAPPPSRSPMVELGVKQNSSPLLKMVLSIGLCAAFGKNYRHDHEKISLQSRKNIYAP